MDSASLMQPSFNPRLTPHYRGPQGDFPFPANSIGAEQPDARKGTALSTVPPTGDFMQQAPVDLNKCQLLNLLKYSFAEYKSLLSMFYF